MEFRNPEPDPEQRPMAGQTLHKVHAAMQRLPPHARRLMDLDYRKERRMKDAAAILGITVATAESRLLRARHVLRRSLKQNGCSTP
jgi:RNA polymerase sigma factor (sigma-70 family)